MKHEQYSLKYIYITFLDNQSKGSPSTPFPFKELARQGVNIKEIVIQNDMSIPTNSATSSVEGSVIEQLLILANLNTVVNLCKMVGTFLS